tara:strand:- start:2565 stop:3650 length:1086 start_codon:yes stop_codon:yes gene_type:complete
MNSLDSLKSSIISQFGTPCAVIDLDIIKKNILRAQKICDVAGVANRPHIKTHKSPLLAKMQIDAGARGITCQKLGEAEVMAEAGIDDILIATNILGAAKSGRLANLQKRLPLKVCADNQISLREYSIAAKAANRPLDVLIECDTGQKRAGVEEPKEAARLIQVILKDNWLKFTGLLYYPPLNGWEDTQVFHNSLTKMLDDLKVEAKIISTGGTPNFANIGKLTGATEHRAGTCIFNDMMMVEDGFAQITDCAFRVFTSVVSRANDDRGILDAGSKTLTSDTGGLQGYGYITEYPEAKIIKFSEEHGFLNLTDCTKKPTVGEIVSVVPNHVCVAVNMVDQLVVVQNKRVMKTIPVAARGMLV